MWRFLASVRLTVVVLLSLAATSIIGTLIPQNESPAAYLRAFGPLRYRLLDALDVFDMYHAWWFQLLLLMLVANIVVCSIDRLSSTARIIFTRRPKYRIERFRKSAHQVRFDIPIQPAALADPLSVVIGRRYGRLQVETVDADRRIFAERWRWTRLGVYAVHASVVILVLGGLIGSIFGFEGYVNIPEGETADTIVLRHGEGSLKLPFAIRCNDFELSLYSNGTPREYRSSVSLLRGGTVIREKEIIVNDPLRFEGINIFQASYGKLPPRFDAAGASAPDKIELEISVAGSGNAVREKVRIGDTVTLPDDLGTVTVDGFLPMADFMGQPIGPAVTATITHPGETAQDVVLPLRFPGFDKMRRGKVAIAARATAGMPAVHYYTGLQVTRDPGVAVVYVGFVIMILGCLVTFFMAHEQVCVEIKARRQGSGVTLYGVTHRNKVALQRRLDGLGRDLAAAAGTDVERAGQGNPP